MKKIISYFSFMIVVMLFIFPYYWMVATSIQPSAMLYSLETLLPRNVSFENFIYLFNLEYFWRWGFNSIFIASITCILLCFISSLSGYAFAKYKFPGRDFIFICLLVTMAIPKQSILLPLYLLIRKFGMLETYQGQILPSLAWPGGLFLMKQAIKTIPNEILDAAKMDGASEWQVFYKIILPLAKPTLFALGIVSFLASYNNYFWQMLLLNSTKMLTLPLAISLLQEKRMASITLTMAGAVVASVPVIIVYLIFQKYLVRGMRIGNRGFM